MFRIREKSASYCRRGNVYETVLESIFVLTEFNWDGTRTAMHEFSVYIKDFGKISRVLSESQDSDVFARCVEWVGPS